MENYTMTKIVATLGPAVSSLEKIRDLYNAGVTMFRINSSHGDAAFHGKNLSYIREVEKEQKTLIPVMLDLQGPKIRVGELENSIELKKGDTLKFQHASKMEGDVIP